ncbi:hypothetical protein L596_013868 [Steinernema carpocapsae]|uniref:Uncharacterized protein n=1 Tax=Steinernema carpocapsae TaxID=34508 RepID=A0A4V6A575_STECR|nr:hypothetical protein L596_013868 [Steinernema carpocapsae]
MASIASIPEQLNGLQLSKAGDASVRLFIPKLAEHPDFRKIVSDLGLNIRRPLRARRLFRWALRLLLQADLRSLRLRDHERVCCCS